MKHREQVVSLWTVLQAACGMILSSFVTEPFLLKHSNRPGSTHMRLLCAYITMGTEYATLIVFRTHPILLRKSTPFIAAVRHWPRVHDLSLS